MSDPISLGDRIENDFSYHPATEKTGPMHDRVREICRQAAHDLEELVPPGRELSLAITSLQEAMMWANAAVACNQEPASGTP